MNFCSNKILVSKKNTTSEQDEFCDLVVSGICTKDGKYISKTLKKSEKMKKTDLSQHEAFRNELKILYTAITRTRLRLKIFDEETAKRKAFEEKISSFEILQELNPENYESLVLFKIVVELINRV